MRTTPNTYTRCFSFEVHNLHRFTMYSIHHLRQRLQSNVMFAVWTSSKVNIALSTSSVKSVYSVKLNYGSGWVTEHRLLCAWDSIFIAMFTLRKRLSTFSLKGTVSINHDVQHTIFINAPQSKDFARKK